MGLGVGWMVELKLNRKDKIGFQRVCCDPPIPAQDPLLIKEQHDACDCMFLANRREVLARDKRIRIA